MLGFRSWHNKNTLMHVFEITCNFSIIIHHLHYFLTLYMHFDIFLFLLHLHVFGYHFKHITCNVFLNQFSQLVVNWIWRAPNSLRDSNMNLNRKQWKSKESGHALWLAALWRGRGACWSSKMRLGIVISINYSHGPPQNQHKVVTA
jgi:hypothetical protein